MNKVYRITIIVLLFYSFMSTANAQVCKISDSGDNVEIFSTSIVANSQVNIIVGNDSQDISANVTVQVKVTYTNNYSKTYTGKKIAGPNCETTIVIPIDPIYPEGGKGRPKSVEVISFSGAKCRQ